MLNTETLIPIAIKIVIAIVILIIGNIVAGISSKLLGKILEKNNTDAVLIEFLRSFVRGVTVVLFIVFALNFLGFATASIIAVLSAAGLAIGLSLQGSLSNLASGVLTIALRPFKQGDYIETAGVQGSVSKTGMFNTQIKTVDNKLIYIPNSQLTAGNIINYSAEPTRRVDLSIGIDYSSDLEKAKKVLLNTLNSHPKVINHNESQVGIVNYGASSIDLTLRAWTNSADYWDVYFDLMQEIKITLDSNNIGIPFPQTVIHKAN